MKPPPFDYACPATLAEAVALLASRKECEWNEHPLAPIRYRFEPEWHDPSPMPRGMDVRVLKVSPLRVTLIAPPGDPALADP